MNELLNRIKSAGSIKTASILSKSLFFNEKDQVSTEIPIINLALSGKLNGGLTPGLTFIAGASKHFKSLLGLMMVKAYMKKYEDSICLFYDSEFGITPEYITSNGIDTDRVIHIPIEHLEQLKFDIAKRLEEIKRGDKVIIFIDSVGNLASKKEVEDALDQKSVADMTRAKVLKSLWRIVTPHLTTKDIPCIAINHTYQEMALYPKAIMSGGTGGMYSANQVFIIGKAQEKDDDVLVGYKFTINIEKSRFVKEKSQLPFTVTYEKGINRWSGLLELAEQSGHITKPQKGWYAKVDSDGVIEEKNYRKTDTDNREFWQDILTDKRFNDFLETKFRVSNNIMIQEEITEDEKKSTKKGK